MRLRTFLIIAGLWVALLPHIGFSITTENVLFSITGFIFIVVSFYVAAVEDKHKHTRVIKDDSIQENTKKALSKLRNLRKTQTKKEVQTEPQNIEVKQTEQALNEPKEDTGPRIRKAVSDVKINMDSLDDIES